MKSKIIKYLKSGLIILTFCGCENLTEEEFKQKYDWAETICTAGDNARGGKYNTVRVNRYYHFFCLNNKKITVHGPPVPGVQEGFQYYILYDKNAPEKHYLILFHRPVRPKIVADFTMLGKIERVKKDKNSLIVNYRCYSIDGDLYKAKGAYPLEYYDILKELEKSQGDITVDCFVRKEFSDGTGYIRTFINLEKLINE